MVELRLLEEFVTTQQRKTRLKAAARLHATPGEEACLVSTLIDLEPGDLVTDTHPGIATAFLRGAKLPDLLNGLLTPAANNNGRRDLHLPFSETGSQRLNSPPAPRSPANPAASSSPTFAHTSLISPAGSSSSPLREPTRCR